MNILFVITALGTGGAENLLVDICGGLRENHTVRVVFLRDKRNFEARFAEMGVKTEFVDLDSLGLFKTVGRLRRVIRECGAQIVHTHLPAADTAGRVAGILSPGVRVFSTIHNTDLWKLKKTAGARLLKGFNRASVNGFKKCALIAVSKTVRDFCIKQEHIRPEKIRVLYNFIDTANPEKSIPGFAPPEIAPGDWVMVVMARLHPTKGHALLLNAMDALAQRGGFENLRLLVLGEGEQREALEAQAARLGLAGRVHFLGVRPNVYDYLRAGQLFVLPSDIEGFSIAVLEAFYCRIPVLGSDIPVLREELDEGRYGVLFQNKNAADLADKIAALYSGEIDTSPMVEQAAAFCAGLTREEHIRKLEEIYSDNT